MSLILVAAGLAVAAGLYYALKHHITVAQAKAKAEAVIAKVKAEVEGIEKTGYADVTSAIARIKALL